ncbi:DUF6191 domain-containing protein [Streptomyces sp. NBC_00704]|uniref:DUF6191 domain-containing protein n=1 Tax=Streptomyces sp. NBC_00704 TaxID=2975809 RepID=UPI002E325CC6|nr:DUF6191 domain-containing protein [Streptomyces sp. NBC_00704]
MFSPFEELFAPGRKHTRDEQNRLELTREDVGDADPGHGPIDLASGKVVVRAAETDPIETDTIEAEPGEGRGEEPAGDGPVRGGPDRADPAAGDG